MYELSRVRLRSVGPPGARYADVVLDLRDVGDLLQPGSRPRRPSPASVLFLENGGGKSVLIKLIFSVMLPGRRQVVGTTNTRVLEKFVTATEVAHVALEWQHTGTGRLRVTGKASQWKGHVISSDPANLHDRWYSFRPGSSLDLDTLPFSENGRPLTLNGFHDRLTEAHRLEPALQLGWTKTHSEWTEHLAELGLDTELFRYQRAMNAGEGEAADVFSFKTDEAFVDFLLKAVIDADDPNGLADVVDRYAHKLAARGGMIAERDFVAGALERLTPLAEAESLAEVAREIAHAARTEAQRFLSLAARRRDAELERLESAKTHLSEISGLELAADQEQRRLNAVVLELRRLVTELRLARARADAEARDRAVKGARDEHEAWRATPTLLAYQAATASAGSLRELVAERVDRARPALHARNEAVQQLGRALHAMIERAEGEATAAAAEAEAVTEEAAELDEQRDAALAEASTQAERAARAHTELEAIRRAVDAATQAGWLVVDADVAAEADLAAALATAAKDEFDNALETLGRLAEESADARNALAEAERDAATAERGARDAATSAEHALAVTADLAGTTRLLELLGADTIELCTDAGPLVERLDEAMTHDQARITELTVADRADRHTLEALGAGGLLPDPPDIAAVVTTLTNAGVTAWSGWRYLSKKDATEQQAVLHRYPQLVDGVVINDANRLERARQILEQARLMPTSVIVVDATATMDSLGPPSAWSACVVPPNPAMYDEHAADAERKSILERVATRGGELEALRRQVATDGQLVQLLRSWQQDFPPGTIASLVSERDRAAEASVAAQTARAAAKSEHDARASAEQRHRERVPNLRTEEHNARNHAERLANLAAKVATAQHWAVTRDAAREAANEATIQVDTARAEAAARRSRVRALERTADGHRRTMAECREELGRLQGAVDETTLPPTKSVPELRDVVRQATEAYAKVEVDADLRAELDQAERTESRSRAEFDALREPIRRRAAELIVTADAATAASRDAAISRAMRGIETLEERVRDALLEVGRIESELGKLAKQDRSIDDYGRPTSIEHGQELIDQAERDWATARAKHEELSTEKSTAETTKNGLEKTVDGFGTIMEPIGDIAAGPIELYPAVFDGTLDDAKTTRKRVLSDLTEAQKLLDREEHKVRAAADDLAGYAGDERFEPAKSPVRRQIVAAKRDDLPRHAAAWEQSLRPRLRTLTDDLAQLDQHRASIVERLRGIVDRALGTLRSAQRLSRLPDGLGEWSGQEFLRVKFAPLDEAQLTARIVEVVDESAAMRTKDGASLQRDGMALLLRGVRAAAPKGYQVDMLKPDAVLRTERQRVSEIGDVFSGGQLLTAAIVLYCTMAALRANDRGRARQPHSGVLFLDNPIGRASASYLLDIQLSVAKALGVQLVYTTGLFDAGALSVFPLLIRLRNDADLRAGKKYLTVESTQRWQPHQLNDPDGTARVDATRVFRRPGDA